MRFLPSPRTLWRAFVVGAALLVSSSCHQPGMTNGAALPADPRSSAAWATLPEVPAEIPPQAACLRGLRIVIDPGHGGDVGKKFEEEGYKRGPTGLREAIINLRTAKELKKLLDKSGAVTALTRGGDEDVSLPRRCQIANEFQADLFVSIHHNSGGETANYGSVWYHQDGSSFPASMDVARELGESLTWWLRHPQSLSNGIYSDKLMYDDGFGVLRDLQMPGVLAECSFFSNRIEEQRLRDERYNERVAMALFLGLCNWAASGVPRWRLAEADTNGDSSSTIFVELFDGMKENWGSDQLRIREESLVVLLNGEEAAHWFLDGNRLQINDPQLRGSKPLMLDVRFQNRAGNACISPPVELKELNSPRMASLPHTDP